MIYLVGVKTRKQAKVICGWASIIRKVDGGYMCFETVNDYAIWKNQK